MLTALSFALGTLICSWVATHLSELWYGAGLVAGSFIGWTAAYGRLRWMEAHLDVHIFCNGHLLKKQKRPVPSSKVFDRYEELKKERNEGEK